MRLIDADELWERLKKHMIKHIVTNTLFNTIKAVVDGMPTIDAVEVVRCKDCKHFKRETENTGVCDGGFCHTPVHVAVIDFCYCNYGERRSE